MTGEFLTNALHEGIPRKQLRTAGMAEKRGKGISNSL